jgi:hypothetical protein
VRTFSASVAAILFCLIRHAYADDQQGAAGIAPSACKVTAVVNAEIMRDVQQQADLARQEVPRLQEMQRLGDKAPAGSVRPLKELLSKPDLAAFDRASADYAFLESWQFTESARARDIESLAKTVEVLDGEYRWGKVPADNTDDDVLVTAAGALAALLGDKLVTPPTDPKVCTFQLALANYLNEVYATLGPDLESMAKEAALVVNTMRITYREQDPTKILANPDITAADRAKLQKVMTEIVYPMQRAAKIGREVEAVMLLDRASDRVYQFRKGHLGSRATFKTLPGAFGALESDPATPEAVNVALRILDNLSMKFPSGHEKLSADIAKHTAGASTPSAN